MENDINLKKLQEDFSARLIEEIRNKKQNEVRFQALDDPRITYDQYSELIKGAHLVPLKREQKAEITKHYKQEVFFSDYDDLAQNNNELPKQSAGTSPKHRAH